jgi:phenylalanyl-tRNA synthetase alpha chain
MPTTITPNELERALALRDLSDPDRGPHAIQLVVDAITEALERAWGCPLRIYRGDPVVTVEDNYGVLGYPPDAPAREARYSRYVDSGHMLRAHTTAMVPAALRALAHAPDQVVACPGLVYRRDVVDRLHVGEPHQLDQWRARRGVPLTQADLDEMVALVVEAVLPGADWRTLHTTHPYTAAGREIEVLVGGEWVELLECGLAGTHVLAAGGLDGGRWSGLALGLGLDRAVMLRKGIGDIRLLRSDDPRVARQMLDLEAYREVSSMPPTTRDVSIAVAADVDAEELGDRVRRALDPAQLEAVEEVRVVGQTPGAELPPQAIARIGLRAGQKNVLLRLVLRHPTDADRGGGERRAQPRVRGRPRGERAPVGGGRRGRPVNQRRACSNRGSSRTAAKSSSLRASSRNCGRSSTDRRRCVNVSSPVSPASVAKQA